jgi:hypothetical protein
LAPMSSRYLHIQHLRLGRAADALVAAREELGGRLPANHPVMPHLYVVRILEDDDGFGTSSGLIVQGDAITWEMVHAMRELSRIGYRVHRVGLRHDERHPPSCEPCRLIGQLNHVHLADGLAAWRQRQSPTSSATIV